MTKRHEPPAAPERRPEAAEDPAERTPRERRARKRPLSWLAGLTWPRGTAARLRRWLTGP